MLNIGDTLEIRGRQCTVCYLTEYEGSNYVCVAYEDPELEYVVYDYKFENNKLFVADVNDQNELNDVMKIFIRDGLEEFGLPEELEEAYSKIGEITEESN